MPNQIPRIRGDNPTKLSLILHQRTYRWHQFHGVCAATCIALMVLGLLLILVTGFRFSDPTGVIVFTMLFAVTIIFAVAFNSTVDQLNQIPAVVPLHAYNTEFIAPLADHSTLLITLHFQIPKDLANSGIVDQLNRVTENILIPFCLPFTTPPSPAQILDHLQITLLQFQNENGISVLRVNVPLAIHRHPDKPRSVHV